MLQRLSIALATVKVDKTTGNLLKKVCQTNIPSIERKKLLKSLLQYNEFSKGIIKNGYYIYEFWKY